MNHFKNLSIRIKLILLCLLIAVLPAVFIAYETEQTASEELLHDAYNNQLS